MAKFTLEDLSKKSDDDLLELFGYKTKIEEFREALTEGAALKGKPREMVETRVNEMLTPRVYPEDLKYTVQRAKAKAEGKEKLCACPSDVSDW